MTDEHGTRFLRDRAEWLEVHVIEVQPDCFDVFLKIDGTYFDRTAADLAARSLSYEFDRYIEDAQ